MITNTRRGTFTVAAVLAGLLLVGGVAGAASLGGSEAEADPPTTDTTEKATTSTVEESSAPTSETTTTVGETTVPLLPEAPATEEPTPTTAPGSGSVDGTGPDPEGKSAYGLCRAFSGRDGQPGKSKAWARLNEAAGSTGQEGIAAWCVKVLADKEAQRGSDDGDAPDADDNDQADKPDSADPEGAGHTKGKGGGHAKGRGAGHTESGGG